MKIQFTHTFESIISVENLLEAWKKFEKGKKNKKDVQIFQIRLMDNIFQLHHELFHHTWKHDGYKRSRLMTQNPETFIKPRCVIAYFITRFTRNCIRFSKKHLLQTRIPASLTRAHIKLLIDSENSLTEPVKTTPKPVGF
jgi:hypothetical protein